jgi:glycosyltransferase involved in cell wall biosynthesis
MNVLCIDQFSEFGGGQLCLRDLIPFMRRAGFKPHAMLPPGGPFVDWMRRASVQVDDLPIASYACGRKTVPDVLRFPVDTLHAAAAIRRAVDRYRIDLAYVNGPRALPAAVLAGVPLVFHAHSAFRQDYVRTVLSWCFRRFNGPVIAASRFAAGGLSDIVPPRRLQVIHNGVCASTAFERCFRKPRLCVGIAGRISPEKGHLDFIRAAELIANVNPHVQFVVVGAPLFSDAGFEAALRERPESARVRFLGWNESIQSSLQDIDILAVPSARNDRFEEACPRVVLEALAAGTPVVAYPSGGIPELIEHGRTGLLTGFATAESLASAILFLMERPGEMERLSAAGRQEWQRRFTVERFGRDVCEVLGSSKLKSGPDQPRQNSRVTPHASDYEARG